MSGSGPRPRGAGPDVLHVVVPAHDEAELLPACLASVATAADAVRAAEPDVVVRVTVVADACTDATAALARAAGVDVLEVEARCVGAAREAGVRRAEECARGLSPRALWLAHTDADTEVPAHWLLAQLALAREGVAMVVGTVVPSREDLTAAAWGAWQERHQLGEGHRHVHGANLGLTLEAHRRAGGFAALPLHEDVLLVAAVRRTGLGWTATDATQVTTSGRRHARAPGGFAAYLTALDGTAS